MIQKRKFGPRWYQNLIAVTIENPFKIWWKVRKYFRFPDIKINLSLNSHQYPYSLVCWRGKILDICIHDVCWKSKFNSPRHEGNPLIYICLFSKLSLWITFGKYYLNEFGEKSDGSLEYWEYILKYLYYSKNNSLMCYSCWTVESKIYKYIEEYGNAEDGSEDKYVPYIIVTPTVAISLNKSGVKLLKEQIKCRKQSLN